MMTRLAISPQLIVAISSVVVGNHKNAIARGIHNSTTCMADQQICKTLLNIRPYQVNYLFLGFCGSVLAD